MTAARRLSPVRVTCQARLNPWPGSATSRPCTFRARWWVGYRFPPHNIRAVCGTHARAWQRRWPLVSGDWKADAGLYAEAAQGIAEAIE